MTRIVFVGDLNPYCRSYQRFAALKRLGHSVVGLSFVPEGRVPGVSPPPSLWARLRHRLGRPIDETDVNKAILEAVTQHKPDLLWIEKGLMITPKTLDLVKQANRSLILASHAEDDMFAQYNQSHYYRKCVPLYDFIFTTKSYNCRPEELPSLGARKVVFTNNTFDSQEHRPVALMAKDLADFGADVGFIGTFEPERANMMLALARAGIGVRVWGNGWTRWLDRHPKLKIQNRPLFCQDFVKSICATKINLAFLRKINRDLQTARSVEIPACGGFMLAERTAEHLGLFEEDREAAFFDVDVPEELLRKARYYLEHDAERQAVARAGRQRILSGGYSHEQTLDALVKLALGSKQESVDQA